MDFFQSLAIELQDYVKKPVEQHEDDGEDMSEKKDPSSENELLKSDQVLNTFLKYVID